MATKKLKRWKGITPLEEDVLQMIEKAPVKVLEPGKTRTEARVSIPLRTLTQLLREVGYSMSMDKDMNLVFRKNR
jgi:hypothetical protein